MKGYRRLSSASPWLIGAGLGAGLGYIAPVGDSGDRIAEPALGALSGLGAVAILKGKGTKRWGQGKQGRLNVDMGTGRR